MDIILLSGVFILSFVCAWFFCLYLRRDGESLWQSNLNWFISSLDDLFLPVADSTAVKIIGGTVLLFALAGFFFPGKIARINIFAINKAVELNSHGKHSEALDILSRYYDSSSPVVHNELGITYLAAGNLEEAAAEFEKAIKMQPEYIQPHTNLAYTYAFLGRESDSAFEVRKAQSLSKYTVDEDLVYGMQESFMSNIYSRIFCMFLFGMAGWYLPRLVIKRLKIRRMKKFDELLPDGLIMATNGLRAGMSLGQVFEVLSREAPTPLNQEFGMIVKEQRLGKGFDEALRGLERRIPTDDTNILINSIVILRDVGGNLTEIFENLAFTIRERKMIKQKISTMTAEGRSQAVILTILPFGLAWLLNKLSPEVFGLMFSTPLGWIIISFTLLWGSIGCFFMWKIVQVKV